MSQICENQSRADQMIDSCSIIVPDQNETDNNMSKLFTQTADSTSVSDLLDLCSGSFVTQVENVSFFFGKINNTCTSFQLSRQTACILWQTLNLQIFFFRQLM